MLKALSVVALIALSGCGAGAGDSGACVQSLSPWTWCHDFNAKSKCDGVKGAWTSGQTCADLGYTVNCTDGSHARPSGAGCVN